MMGRRVSDPEGMEGSPRSIEGLGLLPVETILMVDKTVRRTDFYIDGSQTVNKGYEIHLGVTERDALNSKEFATTTDGEKDGCMAGDNLIGTYLHGCLDNREVIDFLIAPFARRRMLASTDTLTHGEYMEKQYDLLAAEMRKYIDIDRIYEIMRL